MIQVFCKFLYYNPFYFAYQVYGAMFDFMCLTLEYVVKKNYIAEDYNSMVPIKIGTPQMRFNFI